MKPANIPYLHQSAWSFIVPSVSFNPKLIFDVKHLDQKSRDNLFLDILTLDGIGLIASMKTSFP